MEEKKYGEHEAGHKFKNIQICVSVIIIPLWRSRSLSCLKDSNQNHLVEGSSPLLKHSQQGEQLLLISSVQISWGCFVRGVQWRSEGGQGDGVGWGGVGGDGGRAIAPPIRSEQTKQFPISQF